MDDLPERLLHYRLVEMIGRGGMGEVWKAVDTTLDRDVAIKILPEAFAQDHLRLLRFEREAKLLASLNHPNVATIHGLHEVEGRRFLAMEFIVGKDLTYLMAGGPLTVAHALLLFGQVADALEASHEGGVIHRDLKPANIRVTPRGLVKVLDFGLAKSVEPGSSGGSMSLPPISSDQSGDTDGEPTLTSAPTEAGAVLGTAAYMSPEQARGQTVDGRTDIWAFGCVLYEALAGKPAFSGETLPDTLVAVLTKQPDWDALSPETPENIRELLKSCLRKRVELRLQEMGQAREAIEIASDGGKSPPRIPPPTPRKSLAVLPFASLGPSPGAEYLGDGISGEISGALSRIDGLSVVAQASCVSFRGAMPAPGEVGTKLGVHNVVDGDVRWDGDRMHVAARLTSVEDGRRLWSESFDRKLDDVFEVSGEIAGRITGRLSLGAEAAVDRSGPRTAHVNLEAYRWYLEGRFLQEPHGPEAAKAMPCFERALAIDPDYAAALAAQADTRATMNLYGLGHPQHSMPGVKEAAERALRTDDSLAEAHNALALTALWFEWDWKSAARNFQRAIELNPNYALARSWYGFLYLFGIEHRAEEGVGECRRAVELDPLSTLSNSLLGLLLGAAGRYDDAVAHMTRWVEQAPGSFLAHRALGLAHLGRNECGEAVGCFVKAMGLSQDVHDPLAELGMAYAAASRVAEAEMMQARILSRSGQRYVPSSVLSWIPLALGRMEEAFEHLERAHAQREGWLSLLGVWPAFQPARSDPRFGSLMGRVGLPSR